jgi:hypothetical protein
METRYTGFQEYVLSNPAADTPIRPPSRSYASHHWIRGRRKLVTAIHVTGMNDMAAKKE